MGTQGTQRAPDFPLSLQPAARSVWTSERWAVIVGYAQREGDRMWANRRFNRCPPGGSRGAGKKQLHGLLRAELAGLLHPPHSRSQTWEVRCRPPQVHREPACKSKEALLLRGVAAPGQGLA